MSWEKTPIMKRTEWTEGRGVGDRLARKAGARWTLTIGQMARWLVGRAKVARCPVSYARLLYHIWFPSHPAPLAGQCHSGRPSGTTAQAPRVRR